MWTHAIGRVAVGCAPLAAVAVAVQIVMRGSAAEGWLVAVSWVRLAALGVGLAVGWMMHSRRLRTPIAAPLVWACLVVTLLAGSAWTATASALSGKAASTTAGAWPLVWLLLWQGGGCVLLFAVWQLVRDVRDLPDAASGIPADKVVSVGFGLRFGVRCRASRVVFWVGVLGYVVAATVAIAAADLRIFPRGSAAIVGLDGWGLATLWAQVLLAGPFEEMLIVVLPAMLLVGRTGKVRFTVRAVVTLCAVGALLRVLPHLYYAAGAQQSVLPIPDVVAAVAGVVVWAGMWTTVSTLLYVRYGRLWPLIVMHLVWDVVAAVVATIAWSGSVYVAAAALVVVALIVWAERGRPRPELAPSDMTRDRARSGQSAR